MWQLDTELLKPHLPPKRKSISKDMRAKIKAKCNGRCAYCGTELGDKFHVDHAHSYYRGGKCVEDNYLPACAKCNNYKLTYSIDEFRQLIERQLDLAFRNSVNYRTALRYGLVTENRKPVIFYFETLTLKD